MNVFGAAVDPALRRVVGITLVAELRREDDFVPAFRDDRPDQLLVLADPVHVGGVQEGDAHVDRPFEGR